jgi:putative ABC transport system permease protein
MILIFAWRNLWRNKLRSLIIIAAFTLGIFSAIFIIAFLNGMINSRVQAVIGTELSHIQIHKTGFLDNDQFSLRFTVNDSTLRKLERTPHVVASSKRIIINSMVASAEKGTGVKISGIDPDQEKKVTSLHSMITQGEYLGNEGHNSVIVSEKLARNLKVRLHNKIILTVQDDQSNITGGSFRIVGIYHTDDQIFDEQNIFVRNSDLAKLTGISPDEAHEIAILLDDNKNTEKVTSSLASLFPGLEVKNWQQLSPDAGAFVEAMNQYTYIFTLIILLALCFGIVNTMLMVIMERVHELGMLMAIGMHRAKVFTMIMFETILLSLSGGVAGIILGWVATKYFGRNGIDLYFWKEAFGELGYSSLVYPAIETRVLFITTLLVLAAGIVSALYPSMKAIHFKPAQAIRAL